MKIKEYILEFFDLQHPKRKKKSLDNFLQTLRTIAVGLSVVILIPAIFGLIGYFAFPNYPENIFLIALLPFICLFGLFLYFILSLNPYLYIKQRLRYMSYYDKDKYKMYENIKQQESNGILNYSNVSDILIKHFYDEPDCPFFLIYERFILLRFHDYEAMRFLFYMTEFTKNLEYQSNKMLVLECIHKYYLNPEIIIEKDFAKKTGLKVIYYMLSQNVFDGSQLFYISNNFPELKLRAIRNPRWSYHASEILKQLLESKDDVEEFDV